MEDPVFREINRMLTDKMPERPLQPPHPLPANDVFDEWDNALMHDICGKRLAKPIQDLLITLSQADMTRDSFGLNAEQFVRVVIPQLKQLRAGMIDAYKEL